MKNWRDSTDREVLAFHAEALKRAVERAYWFSQEDVAANAHDDLVAVEWRLRQAGRKP